MAIIVLRGVARVDHPDVPGDYSRLPPCTYNGQKWAHLDQQAWESQEFPVYDPVPGADDEDIGAGAGS